MSIYFYIVEDWYISKNGRDSRACGRNQQSACATFTQLWRNLVEDNEIFNNFYTDIDLLILRNLVKDNERLINIYTDTDLLITNMYLHNKGIDFRNLGSHIINITITNTTIEVARLWFGRDNMRITITNTTIEETYLRIDGFRSSNISVHIENSFVRSRHVSSGSHIVFRNCSFTGAKLDNTTSSQPIMSNGWLSFSNVIVEFYNCNITGMTTRKDGLSVRLSFDELIHCDSSNITMINVTVRDNEEHFMRTEGCKVQIIYSDFRNNNGLELFSDRSNITIMNLIFRDNKGRFMSTEHCNVQITHSVFGNNNRSEILSYSSNITLMNITVRENDGRFMTTKGCNVEITDSDFRNNKGIEINNKGSQLLWIYQNINALVLFHQGNKAHVINSTFTGNWGFSCGTLAIESSHVSTVVCQFLGNTAKANGAAMYVSRRSEYHDHGSLFADNTAGEGGKFQKSTLMVATFK